MPALVPYADILARMLESLRSAEIFAAPVIEQSPAFEEALRIVRR